jgi:hypothetical protein
VSKLKKLPEDCTFPQLSTVLDPERFAACLQANLFPERQVEVRGLKVRRIYYKPGRSCRLTFEARLRAAGGPVAEQHYFAKIYPEPKPRSVFRRAQARRLVAPVAGPAVALVPELGMVVWAYPNDPNLPGLATLASPAAVGARIARAPQTFGLPAEGELVDVRLAVGKYVPGQRCGYRYRVLWRTASGLVERRLYGKAYQEGASRAAWEVLAQLWASDACRRGALRIPQPYAHDAAEEIVWQEMLPGKPLSKDAGVGDLVHFAAPVAASLGAFHATSLGLGPGLGEQAELEELAASTAKIARAYPAHAARAEALAARLSAAVPGLEPVPQAPVHGSFKVSHIFAIDAGVAFIDFDGAGLGDPTYDVGRFLAHLAVAGLESEAEAAGVAAAFARFRDAYGTAVPWGWPEKRVRWYTSALLLSSQAYKCVKRLVPGRVEAILGAAESWCP